MRLQIWSREFNKVKKQLISVILADIGFFSLGCGNGWVSPALFILRSNDSPLTQGPIAVNEESLLGGLTFLGSLLGNILFMFITEWIGLKRTICLTSVPGVISWLLVIFTRNIESLYAARFLNGLLGGGLYFSIPLYVTQISDEKVRGILGSLLTVSMCAGILASYILGAYLSYTLTPIIIIIFPIVFVVLFAFIPETPQFLLRKGKVKEAEDSLRFYKNCKENKQEDYDRFSTEMKKVRVFVEQQTRNKLTFSDLCTPEARYGFSVCSIAVLLFTLNGNIVFAQYAISIFKASGSDLDPKMSSIVFGAIQLFATFPTLILIEKMGRRLLLILTTFVCGIALVAIGVFNFLALQDYDVSMVSWIPVLSLSVSVFCSGCGVIPVSLVLMPEVFPNKIRPVGMLIATALTNIILFVVSASFPILNDVVGLYLSMWIFALVCGFACIYSIFFLKETSGTNVNDVGK